MKSVSERSPYIIYEVPPPGIINPSISCNCDAVRTSTTSTSVAIDCKIRLCSLNVPLAWKKAQSTFDYTWKPLEGLTRQSSPSLIGKKCNKYPTREFNCEELRMLRSWPKTVTRLAMNFSDAAEAATKFQESNLPKKQHSLLFLSIQDVSLKVISLYRYQRGIRSMVQLM